MQTIGKTYASRQHAWSRHASAWPAGIDAAYARSLGIALGGWMRERGADALLIGRDTRAISVELAAALQSGVRAVGVRVFDAGVSTAVLLRFGTRLLGTRTLIYIGTASAQSPMGTAFEIEHDGTAWDSAMVAELQMQMCVPLSRPHQPGGYAQAQLAPAYAARLRCDIRLPAARHVVVDGGNGVAGRFAVAALRALGCEVTELFCEPDETHPNHPPEPSDPANLRELQYCVKYAEADLGVAFDSTGTRATMITAAGHVLGGDEQMMLFARSLLESQPGACVVCDRQSSRAVMAAIRAAGGCPMLAHAGQIPMLMRQTGALLGGDAVGHVYLRDRWSVGADAIYATARLLELLGPGQADPAGLGMLPAVHATAPAFVATGSTDPARLLQALTEDKAFLGAYRNSDEDGVRVDYSDGFGAARLGDGPGTLVFRFEADTPEALARIQSAFRRQIRRTAPRLALPF